MVIFQGWVFGRRRGRLVTDRSERSTLLMFFLFVGVWLQDWQEKDAADISVLVFGYRIGRRKTLLMFQCWCLVTGSAGEKHC